MSTKYINDVGEMNGFRVKDARLRQNQPPNPKNDRAAILFERIEETYPEYLDHCYSKPPTRAP